MNEHVRKIVCLGLAGLLLAWDASGMKGLEGIDLGMFKPGAAEEELEYSSSAKEAAEPLRKLLGKSADDQLIKAEWRYASKLVADKDAFSTTGQIRDMERRLKIMRGKKGPEGLGEKFDKAVKGYLGEDDAELDEKLRAKAVDFYAAAGS